MAWFEVKVVPKDKMVKKPIGNDIDSLKEQLSMCMTSNQIAFCAAGILIGIPISVRKQSFIPFALLGVLGNCVCRCYINDDDVGSFVDYSVPYTSKCASLERAYRKALDEQKQIK